MFSDFKEFSQIYIKKENKSPINLSIIIPNYNRAEKVEACLQRILKSTYDLNSVQLLIVDDCSDDFSFDIASKYVKYFSNIVILQREVNSGGASLPRNNAMHFMEGEWLLFIDSDDYITEHALTDAFRLIEKDGSIDMVCMPYFKEKGSLRGISASSFNFSDSITGLQFKDTNLFNSLNAVGKLFKTSLIYKYKIDFPLNIRVREDNWFMMKMYSVVKNIAILGNKKNYYYVCDYDEVSLSSMGTAPRDAVKIYLEIYKFILNNKDIDNEEKYNLLSIYLNRYVKFIVRGKYSPMRFFRSTQKSLDKFLENRFIDKHSRKFIDDLKEGKYSRTD